MASRKTPFLIAALLSGVPQANGGPIMGLEWTALPENPTLQSTLDVGEFDGILRPNLTPYIGWRHNKHQLLGGFGIALFSNSLNDTQTQLGNLRFSADYRYSLGTGEKKQSAWLGLGGHQLVPLLKDENPEYSDSEKEVADAQLSERRAQLAGTGFRFGGGVDVPISPAVTIGIHHHIALHLNFRSVEEATLLTSFTTGETGFKAHIEF